MVVVEGAEQMAKDAAVAERVSITSQLARYPRALAPRLAACAGLSVRIAQLSVSHPVLFHALATSYGPAAARRRAVRLTIEGRPLREVAAAVGLPLCFKRIAPESCGRKLPYVPWDGDAGRRLGAHIPKDANGAARWLLAVSLCGSTCHQRFAVWVAQQTKLFEQRWVGEQALLPLAMYAWHGSSNHAPEALRPEQRWTARMNLRSAATAAAAWVRQLRLHAELGTAGVSDAWVRPASCFGHEFVALTTPQALLDEARAMHNCVDIYGSAIASGTCRLFSMRRGGRRLATIEIRPDSTGTRYVVAQMKGWANASCTLETCRAANLWLESEGATAPQQAPYWCEDEADGRLRDLLAPYAMQLGADGRALISKTTNQTLSLGMKLLATKVGIENLRV